MVMLPGLLAIAFSFLGPEDTKPATADMNVYKSSQLGFSIQYLAAWEKCRDKQPICGTGLMGLTHDQRLKKPISPVIFSPSCRRHRMEGLRVKIFRRYEQVLAKHVASLTPSVPGFKKVVADFEFGAGRLGKKVTLGPESWTYVLLADERLFELSGLCWNNWEAALLERTFDAMAKSLTLSVPVDGRGTPGTYRTYEGASFSFEYPADWTVAGSYDDDENIGAGVDKSLYIHAPYDPEQPTVNKRTYIGCSQYPLQPNDKATIDDYVREGKHGLSLIEGETSFGYEAFETRLGQKGIKHWYVVKIPPNHETNFVAFALPTRLGRLQILGFWYDADQRDALEPVFEHVGRSLVVK